MKKTTLKIIATNSTFAWYQSTAAASAIGAITSTTLSTTVGTASAQKVTVNFTFATTATGPELTNDAGETWYYLDAGKTQLKQNTSEVGVATYTVSVANLSSADATIWGADTTKEATTDVNFTLTASSPLVLLKSASSVEAGAKGAKSDNVEASITIVVTITKSTGACAVKSVGGASGAVGKYGVRANASNIEEKATIESTLSSCLTIAPNA